MRVKYAVSQIVVPQQLSSAEWQRILLVNGRPLIGTIELPPNNSVYFIGGRESLTREISSGLDAITGLAGLGNCALFGVLYSRTSHNFEHIVTNVKGMANKHLLAPARAIKRNVFGKSTKVVRPTTVKLKTYTILQIFPWFQNTILGPDLAGARQIVVHQPGTLTVDELTTALTEVRQGQSFLPEYEGELIL